MPKITHTLAALLHVSGDGPASEGATLRATAGYDVQLLNALPDPDGLVIVQAYPQRVKPEDVGLYFRPSSVIMELTEAEAAPVLEYYRQQTAGPVKPSDFPVPSPDQPPAAGQPSRTPGPGPFPSPMPIFQPGQKDSPDSPVEGFLPPDLLPGLR